MILPDDPLQGDEEFVLLPDARDFQWWRGGFERLGYRCEFAGSIYGTEQMTAHMEDRAVSSPVARKIGLWSLPADIELVDFPGLPPHVVMMEIPTGEKEADDTTLAMFTSLEPGQLVELTTAVFCANEKAPESTVPQPDWVAGTGTNVRRYRYDVADRTLLVEFRRGVVYRYHDVPLETYDRLVEADSSGSFIAAHVKNDYPFERVDLEA